MNGEEPHIRATFKYLRYYQDELNALDALPDFELRFRVVVVQDGKTPGDDGLTDDQGGEEGQAIVGMVGTFPRNIVMICACGVCPD